MQASRSRLDTHNDISSTANSSNDSSNIVGPLQSLNSSLKRIRLQETKDEKGEPMTRSDSLEQAWGVIDLTELDEDDFSEEIGSSTIKKARKEDEYIQQNDIGDIDDIDGISGIDDMDDMDDFMPRETVSSIGATIETISSADRRVASENTTADRNMISSTSSLFTVGQKSQLSKTQNKAKPTKTQKPARSHSGMEDVFSEAQVRSWSEVRIKTWENRRTNTEGFYYRFVDPTEGQQNGPWSSKSIREFMARLEEWKARGIRIGTSWGVFSMSVSHKAGYQCSSYYRKLLETKKLTDPAYAWEGGKLVMISKGSGGEMAISGLSERWNTDEVKEIEANVNRWIKEYHSNVGTRITASRPKKTDSISSASKLNMLSTAPKSTVTMFKSAMEAPRVKATTVPAMPKALSIRPSKQPAPDEIEMIPAIDINDKLAEYASFMKKSTNISNQAGTEQIKKQTISLTVAGNVTPTTTPPARGFIPVEVRKAPLATSSIKGQTGLSLFWKNIRPVRVECPDIPKYIIPKDVELRPTWAHRIQPFAELDAASVEGSIFKEVPKMIDFDWTSLSEGFEEPVADIQGVLADPPWNFIVEDGRNDGLCQLTTRDFATIMEKVLELMPNGIVSVWTHKNILPEVVAIMHSLGCRYVENLVWYKMALNNTNLNRPSPFFRSSKEILLMFKKGDGFDIRHQRTADVIIDFEKPTSCWIKEDYTEPKPEGAYEMMETLLPDARYMPESGRGRLLEIWGKKSQERRPGWFSIHELKRPLQKEESPSQAGTSIKAEPQAGRDDPDGDADSIDEALLEEIANDMAMDL